MRKLTSRHLEAAFVFALRSNEKIVKQVARMRRDSMIFEVNNQEGKIRKWQ